MGKHLKIDPLPEPIKPGVHDLDAGAAHWSMKPYVEAQIARRTQPAAILHVDHRGDGSMQPVAPTQPDRIAEGWALVSNRDRRRLALKYPELITAIVRHIEGTD